MTHFDNRPPKPRRGRKPRRGDKPRRPGLLDGVPGVLPEAAGHPTAEPQDAEVAEIPRAAGTAAGTAAGPAPVDDAGELEGPDRPNAAYPAVRAVENALIGATILTIVALAVYSYLTRWWIL